MSTTNFSQLPNNCTRIGEVSSIIRETLREDRRLSTAPCKRFRGNPFFNNDVLKKKKKKKRVLDVHCFGRFPDFSVLRSQLKLGVVWLVWFTMQSTGTGENDFPDRMPSLLENSIEIVL